MSSPDILARIKEAGISYEVYVSAMAKKVAQGTDNSALSAHDAEYLEYIKLNIQRTRRVEKTALISPRLQQVVEAIRNKQTWLVITEDWCGDSAQVLPQIARIAGLNPLLELRILPRDEHLDIMDLFLTNGKRAIPKLVVLDAAGRQLFDWGPRPLAAAELYSQAVQRGEDKSEIMPRLHLWYARDRGHEVEEELYTRLAAVH